MIGEQIGAYRVVSKLGAGGMGVVYIGEHVELGSRVAIKLLLPELSSNQEAIQRFFNEAKAATRIKNAGIVQVYDFGRHSDGAAYFVMELLEGQSLAARLKERGGLPSGQVAQLGRQIANTLAAAHAQGIVHRDLKPDNVMLVPDSEVSGGERARILDFGIAKLADSMTSEVSLKTRTGSLMGTPYYMSPEQARGAGEVDLRSDIYSVGCILFEMVAGRPPFAGQGLGEVLGQHQFVAAPSLSGLAPSVAPELEQTIQRALAKAPEDRFQTMSELAAELDVTVRTSTGLAAVAAPPSAQVAAIRAPSSRVPAVAPLPTGTTGAVARADALPASDGSADLVPAGGGKGRWITVALLGCVAAAAVAFFVLRNRGSGGDGRQVATLTPDAGTAPPAQPEDPAVARARSAVDRLVQLGRCDEARAEAQSAGEILPDQLASLQAAAAACQVAPTPVKPTPVKPTPVKPDPVKPTPVKPAPVKPDPVKPDPVKPAPVKPDPIKPPPDKPPVAPAAPTDSDGLERAKTAFFAQQWAEAIDLAREVLKKTPKNAQAAMIGTVSACNLKRPKIAEKMSARLPAGQLDKARAACQKVGFTLP